MSTEAMVYGANHRKKRDWRRIFFISLFLLPAVAFLGFFMYYPIEETFRLSLMRSTGLGGDVFIKFDNYKSLFFGASSEEFLRGLRNVLVWAFYSVVIQVPLAFFIAFSLTAYRNKISNRLRIIYYLANILPSTITSMLGLFVFGPQNGIINSLANAWHIGWLAKIDFLGDPRLAFWSIFIMATWAYSGFGCIYLMANIEQIPAEMREAAELDGANRWQYARYVVVPMVSYPLRIMAIINTVGSLRLFDLPYLMTRGGPGYYTTTLGIITYQNGFVNSQYGKAAAVGVVIFLLSLAFTIAQFSLQGKDKEGGAR